MEMKLLPDLFADNLGHERAAMPQIPRAFKASFLDALREGGISVREETVAARSLAATQKDYAADIIAFLRQEEESGNWGRGGGSRIVVSRESRVLDGHHRWAYRAQDDREIEVLRVDKSINDLMDLARGFNLANGIAAREAS